MQCIVKSAYLPLGVIEGYRSVAVDIRAAFREACRQLDALLGRAVYRHTVSAANIPALGSRLERSLRARYESDGFAVQVEERFGSWFLHAHRGLFGGFGVGLIPTSDPGRDATVLVGVGRSSRLDRHAGWVAGGLAIIAAALSVLAIAAAGWPLLGPVGAAVVVGVTVVALLIVYQFLIPFVALFEFLGGGRFTEEQMTAVVSVVRDVIENVSLAPNLQQSAKPSTAPGRGEM